MTSALDDDIEMTGSCPFLRVQTFAGWLDLLIWPLLTSADHKASCLQPPRPGISASAGRQISPGNAHDLHPIYPPHIQTYPPGWLSGFEDHSRLARICLPRMRFLFVGPGFCLQLPSDSASRRTPLLFG